MGTVRRGFTLLEVVVAVAIFAMAVSVILFVASRNTGRVSAAGERLRALELLKRKVSGIDDNGSFYDMVVDEEDKQLDFGITERKFTVKDKSGLQIMVFYYYGK